MPDEAATVDPEQDYLRSRGLMPAQDITDLENLNIGKRKEISDKAQSEIMANQEQRHALLARGAPQVTGAQPAGSRQASGRTNPGADRGLSESLGSCWLPSGVLLPVLQQPRR